ncbi:hypothetical protein BD779DRAFT_1417212, partial [Infundibulicybe gibba]
YFFTQIPHPMQRNSETNAILSVGLTSIHNFPKPSQSTPMITIYMMRTFLHSWAHRLGLHRFESTMAIRVILSAMI